VEVDVEPGYPITSRSNGETPAASPRPESNKKMKKKRKKKKEKRKKNYSKQK